MIAIAVLGLVVSLVGTVVGWQLVGDLDRGVGQSLELTGEVLVTVDESFTIAEDALEILTAGVDEAESAVRSLSRSLEEGEDALASATALTGGEIADALESVERSLPDVEAAANAIDDALRTLDALPLPFDYDPERPLGDTIGDLRTDLRELPDELREQAAQVELMSQELSAATAGARATADALAQLEDRLGAASELIADYVLSTGDARALVDEQREVLATSVRRARALVLAFGLMFALSQFVPLYLGLGLAGGTGSSPTRR
jgi:DNA repair ATPase RecN